MPTFQVIKLQVNSSDDVQFFWSVPRATVSGKPSVRTARCEHKQGGFNAMVESLAPLMQPSTVHHAPSGETKIDDETRKSHSYDGVSVASYSFSYRARDALEEACKKIHPRFNGDAQDQLFDCDSSKGWQLLRYTVGDFFDTHTDGQLAPDHWCTALLFPPANLSPFEGGELDFGEAHGKIEPATFVDWTMVLMPIALPHKCCPITKGVRYVLKASLFLPAWIWNLDALVASVNAPLPCEMDVSAEVRRLRKQVDDMEVQLAELRANIQRVEAHEPSPQSLALLEQVRHATTSRVIVLLNHDAGAKGLVVTELTGEDRRLFNLLVQHFPNTSLVPGPVLWARGEETYDSEAASVTTTTLADMWTDSEEAEALRETYDSPCVLFQDGQDGAASPCSVSAEYNDSSYDRKIYFATLMLVIRKA